MQKLLLVLLFLSIFLVSCTNPFQDNSSDDNSSVNQEDDDQFNYLSMERGGYYTTPYGDNNEYVLYMNICINNESDMDYNATITSAKLIDNNTLSEYDVEPRENKITIKQNIQNELICGSVVPNTFDVVNYIFKLTLLINGKTKELGIYLSNNESIFDDASSLDKGLNNNPNFIEVLNEKYGEKVEKLGRGDSWAYFVQLTKTKAIWYYEKTKEIFWWESFTTSYNVSGYITISSTYGHFNRAEVLYVVGPDGDETSCYTLINTRTSDKITIECFDKVTNNNGKFEESLMLEDFNNRFNKVLTDFKNNMRNELRIAFK